MSLLDVILMSIIVINLFVTIEQTVYIYELESKIEEMMKDE